MLKVQYINYVSENIKMFVYIKEEPYIYMPMMQLLTHGVGPYSTASKQEKENVCFKS